MNNFVSLSLYKLNSNVIIIDKNQSKTMQVKFKMRMMEELKFFIGIQINQCKDEVFVHQTKYARELLKKFKIDDCNIMTTHVHRKCNISKEESNTIVC